MCLGAAVVSRVSRVVFAARSPKYGAFSSGGLALDCFAGQEAGQQAGQQQPGQEGAPAGCAACLPTTPPMAWLRASPVKVQVACAEDSPLPALQSTAAQSKELLGGFFSALR